jgi:hypothetical protein
MTFGSQGLYFGSDFVSRLYSFVPFHRQDFGRVVVGENRELATRELLWIILCHLSPLPNIRFTFGFLEVRLYILFCCEPFKERYHDHLKYLSLQ